MPQDIKARFSATRAQALKVLLYTLQSFCIFLLLSLSTVYSLIRDFFFAVYLGIPDGSRAMQVASTSGSSVPAYSEARGFG